MDDLCADRPTAFRLLNELIYENNLNEATSQEGEALGAVLVKTSIAQRKLPRAREK
jgi:hypothetical protein